MSSHRAAGYTTIPPEFHTDVFVRLLVRPGASRAAATSQGPPYMNTAHHKAPGYPAKGMGQSAISAWAQVSVHRNPCVDVFMLVLNFMLFVLAVASLLVCRLKHESKSQMAFESKEWMQIKHEM